MDSRDMKNKIKEIDCLIKKIEKSGLVEKVDEVKKEKVDQTKQAIETLREVTTEFMQIEDLEVFRDNNKQTYDNMILTIVSWFWYLKREKIESTEYSEAKKLIMSIGEKHNKLYDWCKEFVDKPLPEDNVETSLNLNDIELNVDKSNELIIKDGVKIVVDQEKAKELIDTELVLGSKEYNKLKFEYKIIVNDKEYTSLCHIVDYIMKEERSEDCPYFVSLMEWKKNEKGERVLIFDVFER